MQLKKNASATVRDEISGIPGAEWIGEGRGREGEKHGQDA